MDSNSPKLKNKSNNYEIDFKTILRFIIISIGIILLIIITIVIVNAPALFNFCILGANSANIGNAIGGIATVVIGIVNIFMLYLAFKVQYQANQAQNQTYENEKKRNEKEIEKNEKEIQFIKKQITTQDQSLKQMNDKFNKDKINYKFDRYFEKFEKLKDKWLHAFSLQGNNKYPVNETNKAIKKAMNTDNILSLYIKEYSAVLETLSKDNLPKKSKQQLYDYMRPFYSTFIIPIYNEIKNDDTDLQQAYSKIEKIFIKKN